MTNFKIRPDKLKKKKNILETKPRFMDNLLGRTVPLILVNKEGSVINHEDTVC